MCQNEVKLIDNLFQGKSSCKGLRKILTQGLLTSFYRSFQPSVMTKIRADFFFSINPDFK